MTISDKICYVEGCNFPVNAYGLCQKHRQRQRRKIPLNGYDWEASNVLYLGEDKTSLQVKPVTYKVVGDCWIIESNTTDQDGYGVIKRVYRGVVYYRAHRASYAYYNGNLEKGELVRHMCNNPSCINPSHLVKGTHQENMDDRMKAGNYHIEGGRRKLSKEQVLKVCAFYKEGTERKKIAKITGINYSTVVDITRGTTWNHVTGIPKYKPKINKERGEQVS